MFFHRLQVRLLLIVQFFVAFFLCSSLSFAQTEEKLENYATHIAQYNHHNPQEKAYLHLDNRSYFIGDTIWFKAYVMNATTLYPTQISNVLYVELLNDKGVEVDRKKMRLENGMCHGDFILKDSYRTGYYELRAYTRYMLNWGNEGSSSQELMYQQLSADDRHSARYTLERDEKEKDLIPDYNHCVFSRVVPIYMRPEKAGQYKREMEHYPYHTRLAMPEETEIEFREDDLKLSFYPEGGHMIVGIENCVAFEVVDQWGRKQKVEGYITKARKEHLQNFSSNKRGRGTFTICPQKGERYIAHIDYKGKSYTFKLPQPTDTGIAMHVSPSVNDSDVRVDFRASTNREPEILGIALRCRGALYVFDTLTIQNEVASSFVIPRRILRSGVNQLTLFNAHGEVLADRLFFVTPPPQPKLSISGVPDSVKPYEEVTLKMQLNTPNSWMAQGHFSLSVTDIDERGESFDTRDIRSELLLSSDLKGFIEDADSYFRHTDDSLMAADLDLLMMVQGWRRYEWHPYAEEEHPLQYVPEKGLMLDGYVVSEIVANKSLRNPDNYPRIPNLKMEVSIKSPMVTFVDSCVVDSAGQFSLDINRHFLGEALMTLTLTENNGKNKKRKILPSDLDLKYSYPVIHRVYSPLPCAYNYYQEHTPADEALLLDGDGLDWNMEGVIGEVTVKKRFKRKSEIYYENPDMTIHYFKEWNHVIDRGCPLMNYGGGENPNNTVLLNYHLGRMRLSQNPNTLREYDSLFISQTGRFFKPYHMPDTIRVYTNLCSRDLNSIYQVDDATEHLELLRCVFSYLKRSESPRRAPYMPNKGVRHTYYEGYSRVHSFYEPDYSECALPDSADYRRTLHWEPNIWTDNLGRASTSFYNNKQTKKLHIRAEGFTRNGEFIVYDSEQK